MAPYSKPLTNWVLRKVSFLFQEFGTTHMLLLTCLATYFLCHFDYEHAALFIPELIVH